MVISTGYWLLALEYLYRCAVCGEELLVNEAIIDAAIGMATFRGE